jgi:hypothetical protein
MTKKKQINVTKAKMESQDAKVKKASSLLVTLDFAVANRIAGVSFRDALAAADFKGAEVYWCDSCEKWKVSLDVELNDGSPGETFEQMAFFKGFGFAHSAVLQCLVSPVLMDRERHMIQTGQSLAH